ncbi:MAG: PHP domain-containing protein [Elusimicrobiota bacterium]|jgi:predicted metal-dependent phosphoesterase TrpH|nr:PHP domain-containing protein [Elusimicrobiota bacterium]
MNNEKFVDMHVHTIYSDGTWTPAALVEAAIKKNLAAIAITDHDSIDGVEEVLKEAQGKDIEIVAGVELSSFIDGIEPEVHVLGYFLDYQSDYLKKELDIFRQVRLERAYDMVEKLKMCGVRLKDISFVENAGRMSVGRLHFAKAILKEGFVSSIQEAFFKYIGRGKPAYVQKFLLSSADAVKLILKAGGIPVIAHPYYMNDYNTIKDLTKEGLMGIEVWHTKHNSSAVKTFLKMADELNLIATGGSDCHGAFGKEHDILGSQRVPYSVFENLKKAKDNKSL